MKWKITFFNEKVENEILKFPPGILANFLHILELIENYGPSLGRPHTKPMKKGLFEITAKGQEGIGRAFFCIVENKEIVIVHSIIKKTKKTPTKDLELARKRIKELMR